MNIVTQNYDLDMIPGDVPLIVPVKQYDNTSRQIQFTLYSGSNAFILQSTASVRCDGTKPDGNGFSETCSYSGNVVTLVVTQQMAAVSGNVPCQLTVTDGTGVIGTATFILFVWPAALNSGTVVSDSDVAAIIAQAQAAANSAAEAESAANEAVSAVASKADKAQPSAANNVALLSADGNLLDSGKQLTPEAIGAAPAGYGLGGTDATQLADVPENESGNKDLNLAVNNGWYYIYNSQNYDNFPGTSDGGPDGGYHVMRVDTFRTLTQTIYFGYQDWAGCIIKRYQYHGTGAWSEWEWINPPMVPGVLYRTTERFNGWQPVYIIAISCGTMPDANSTKTVAHGVSGISAIVSKGGYMSVSGSTPLSIPFASTTTNYCNLGVDYQNIRIVAGSISLTGYTESVVWFKCTLSA